MADVRVVPGSARFRTRTDWLNSAHCFSFGEHYDPDNVGFGRLMVSNHERLVAGRGFGDHPHVDAEIVTWVLSGSLRHADSTGHQGIVHRGLAQRMSAGRGVVHTEMNDVAVGYLATTGGRSGGEGSTGGGSTGGGSTGGGSTGGGSTGGGPYGGGSDGRRALGPRGLVPVEYVQMWVRPDRPGTEPSYAQAGFDPAELDRGWVAVASGSVDALVGIGAQATLWVTRLAEGVRRRLPEVDVRQLSLHCYLAAGTARLHGWGAPVELTAGDVVRIVGAHDLAVVGGAETAEMLVWQS